MQTWISCKQEINVYISKPVRRWKTPQGKFIWKKGFKLKDWGKSMTRTTTATISLFSKIKIIKGDLSLFKTLIVFKTSPGLRFSYISRIPIIFNFVLCTNLTFITIPIRIPRSNTKLIFIIYWNSVWIKERINEMLNYFRNPWPNLKNLSGGLNLSRGLIMAGST